MNAKQIVVGINMERVVASAFVEGTEIDVGMSQSILARILRDHLQARYPQHHVSVSTQHTGPAPIRVYIPQDRPMMQNAICSIFREILQRANWLVTV